MWQLDIYSEDDQHLATHDKVSISTIDFEDESGRRRSGLAAKNPDDTLIEVLEVREVGQFAFEPDHLAVRGVCGILGKSWSDGTTLPGLIYGELDDKGVFQPLDPAVDELPEHIWKLCH